jgi:hypothetical protein
VHGDVAACCNPNFAQVTAQFVRAMWMRTPEGGLAAMLYGPSTVSTKIKDVTVHLDEKTNYPFASSVAVTVNPDKPADFALVFRNPQWSKATQVKSEGATVTRTGDYFTVHKLWKKGDQVTLSFQESIVAVTAANGEVALQRGPLVYALEIPSVEHQTKTYSLPGFADSDYAPAEGAVWSYELDGSLGKSDFGFKAASEPAADMTYPFDGAPVRLQGKAINLLTAKRVDVSLIPMGSSLAMLRRVTFPAVIAMDWLGQHQPVVCKANSQR